MIYEKVTRDLIESGKEVRYKAQAYGFVMGGLEFQIGRIGIKRHLTGQELSIGLADYAGIQFGPLACCVLSFWGIHGSHDFGHIVYAMIDIGLMSRKEEDQLQDFFDAIDLGVYLNNQNFYTIDASAIKRIRGS